MDAIDKFISLNNTHQSRIAVVGDPMLDEYYFITANRVSPEFPIPVLHTTTGKPKYVLPGGSANVCHQFKHFNADVKFFGPICERGRAVFNEYNINTDHCVALAFDQHIPIKSRYYDSKQDFPLTRIDNEVPGYGTNTRELQKNVLSSLHSQIDSIDVVIFSDYNKGMFVDYTNPLCNLQNKITIVDPKKGPLEKWKGCTILKPNEEEAKNLTGRTEWKLQCEYLHIQTDCTAVVITQGGRGVVGMINGRFFEYHPLKQVIAESVIGAGDCFMAFLAMCMAQQMDIMQAVEIAFEAGATYVQRKHNQPVSIHELKRHIDPIKAKMVSPVELQDRNFKLVFNNGCYDILHAGHIDSLRFAKSKGDKLVVALNSDASIKRLKGENRPINKLEDRMYLIAALEFVDYVVSFDDDTPYEIIKQIKPDVLVKSGQWEGNVVGSDIVSEVCLAPMVEGYSTTNMIQKCQTEH